MKKLFLVFLSGIFLFAACKQAANGPDSASPPKIMKNLSNKEEKVALTALLELEVIASGNGISYTWFKVEGDKKTPVTSESASGKYTVPTDKHATLYFFCRVYHKESGKATSYTDSIIQKVVVGNGGNQGGGTLPNAEPPQIKNLPSLTSWSGRSFSLTVHPTSGTAPASWTYQWYESDDTSKTNSRLIANASGRTYTTSKTEAKKYYYYCKVTNAPTGKTPASKESTVAAVTVTANPPAQAQVPHVHIEHTQFRIDPNETVTLSVNVQVTDTGVLSYQWYTTEETTATGGALLSGKTESSLTVSPTQTTKYYCQVTNTLDTGASAPLTAVKPSELITVTVNGSVQPVQPAKITAPTGEQTKTTPAGTSITLSVTATSPDSGTLTYQWYSNTAKSTVGGQLISGAESTEYSVPAQSSGIYYFYCEVTNTKGGKSAVPVKSPVFTVTVTQEKQPAATPVITHQPPATLKLQKGQSQTIEITATISDGGTLSHEWYQSATGTDEGSKLTNTAHKFTIPTENTGTTYYRCKIINTNTNALAGQQTASVFTNWFKVEVTEEDTLSQFTVTASSAASARIATGKTAAFTVQINNTPDGVQQGIQWYKGTPPTDNTAAPAGTQAAGTANETTYTTPVSLTAGTHTFYCQVTVTRQVSGSDKTAKKYSPAFTVTVVEPAAPTISVQPKGGQAVKNIGVPLTITAAVDQTASIGNPAYQWYKHTKKEAANGVVIDAATTAAYTAQDEGTFYYYCVVSNSEDTSKTVTSDVVTAVVYRDAAAAPVDMNGDTDGLGWDDQNWALGSKKGTDGTTFAVYSEHAERVVLEIYDAAKDAAPKGVFVMEKNSTDNIWRVKINTSGITGKVYYGYRAWGPNWTYDSGWTPGTETGFKSDVDAQGNRFNPNKLLTDPYSIELSHTRGTDGSFYQTGNADRNKDSGQVAPKSAVVTPITPLGTVQSTSSALTTEVIYQLHVKGFTGNGVTGADSVTDFDEADKGTYSGAAKMIPYLEGLGVNTVLLMPVFESEGLEDYAPANFFAVKKAYARDKDNAAQEFQNMVKAFHTKNIQVFLDVPYANSGENGILDSNKNKVRLESLRGLDNTAYYALTSTDKTDYWVSTDYMNNLNGSSTQVQDLILASLKYWTETMGIDGFRFSSGATLGREESSGFAFNKDAQLLTEIKTYLAGKNRKYIIETKDKNNPSVECPDGWIAWNNTFRGSVRKVVNWVKPLNESQLNTTIKAAGTLNFAASDTGLRIRDSLNRTGSDDGEYAGNFDETNLRQRYRNLLILTLLSKGAPVLTYGDEFGRGQNGHWSLYDSSNVETNNYNSLQTASTSDKLLYEFTKKLLKLRKDNAAFFKDATYTFKKFDNSGDAGDDQAFCILISNADNSVQYAVCVNHTGGTLEALVKDMGGGTKLWKPLIDTGSWAEAKNDSAKMEGNFYADDKDPLDKYGVEANRIVVLKKEP